MQFYLGTHQPHWLERTDVDLFVSHRTLAKRKRLPRAVGRWALDSGGYTELSMFGEWRTSTSEYVDAVARYGEEIGGLEWAAPQDWMCEPWIVAKTGLTVAEHQRRTVDNYLELRDLGPFVPVLQGWTRADYLAHVGMYNQAGVDLTTLPLVGIGSVCRRQQSSDTEALIIELADAGIRLHGFGFKRLGLARVGWTLASSDSLAWSFDARRSDPLPGCTHQSCANCMLYAMRWRARTLRILDEQQTAFPLGA